MSNPIPLPESFKPDMPFNGAAFYDAVRMWTDDISMKYLRCIWHYWNHTQCQGLPDDDAGLMRLCCCAQTDWMRVKGLIFDNYKFFKLENGRWHQDRARRVWAKTVETFQKNQNKTQPARDARASKDVTAYVTENEEWLKQLEQSPAFKHLQVRLELEKARQWIAIHPGRTLSRKFLLNWLNKQERPMEIASKTNGHPKLSEVHAECRMKWPDESRAGTWAASFHGAWSRREWKRNGKAIDWKIELSNQVSTWRTTE